MTYLKALYNDPLFYRVCMLIWGTPFALFSVFVLISWQPTEVVEWAAYVAVAALGWLGLYLIYCALVDSKESLGKAAGFMGDGGDIVGLVAAAVVCVIALPTVAVVRALWPQQDARR